MCHSVDCARTLNEVDGVSSTGSIWTITELFGGTHYGVGDITGMEQAIYMWVKLCVEKTIYTGLRVGFNESRIRREKKDNVAGAKERLLLSPLIPPKNHQPSYTTEILEYLYSRETPLGRCVSRREHKGGIPSSLTQVVPLYTAAARGGCAAWAHFRFRALTPAPGRP